MPAAISLKLGAAGGCGDAGPRGRLRPALGGDRGQEFPGPAGRLHPAATPANLPAPRFLRCAVLSCRALSGAPPAPCGYLSSRNPCPVGTRASRLESCLSVGCVWFAKRG